MKKILLIDDDTLMRKALGRILTTACFEVTEAEDGEQAIKAYRNDQFDLVITDMVMPDKEGIEIIRELRKQNSDIKIIAISAGGRAGAGEYLKWAKLMGAKECLPKPIKREDLLRAVAKTLIPAK